MLSITPTPFYKKPLFIGAVAIILLAVVGVLIWYYSSSNTSNTTPSSSPVSAPEQYLQSASMLDGNLNMQNMSQDKFADLFVRNLDEFVRMSNISDTTRNQINGIYVEIEDFRNGKRSLDVLRYKQILIQIRYRMIYALINSLLMKNKLAPISCQDQKEPDYEQLNMLANCAMYRLINVDSDSAVMCFIIGIHISTIQGEVPLSSGIVVENGKFILKGFIKQMLIEYQEFFGISDMEKRINGPMTLAELKTLILDITKSPLVQNQNCTLCKISSFETAKPEML